MLTIRNYDVTFKMSWPVLEPSSVKIESFEGDFKRKHIKHARLKGYVYNFKKIARDLNVYQRYVDPWVCLVIVPRMWVF